MKANILQEQSKPKRFDCGERFQQKNFFLKRCTPGGAKIFSSANQITHQYFNDQSESTVSNYPVGALLAIVRSGKKFSGHTGRFLQ